MRLSNRRLGWGRHVQHERPGVRMRYDEHAISFSRGCGIYCEH